VTIPQAFGLRGWSVVEQARAANLALEIVARAHTDDEVEYLTRLGADLTVMGEREIAHRMIGREPREDAPDNEPAAGRDQPELP
jgi:monovalent cation:H+ antiporter-2, CPA2 family